MCYRCPGLSGQVPWLWQCPCLLEKVSLCQWHGSALSEVSSSKLGEESSPHPNLSGKSQDQSMLPLEAEILPCDFSDMLVLTQTSGTSTLSFGSQLQLCLLSGLPLICLKSFQTLFCYKLTHVSTCLSVWNKNLEWKTEAVTAFKCTLSPMSHYCLQWIV